MNAPTGRRPPGPLLPEDQAGGSASAPHDHFAGPSSNPAPAGEPAAITGDVRAGVEAWLAGHGVSLPPAEEPADTADTAGSTPRRERRDGRGRGGRDRRPAPPPEDAAGLDPEADHEAVARKILLDQLTGQARSRSELATKLARKGVPEEVAMRLLDRFEEVGLVDDAAFARLWVESRQSGKGLARRALAQELRRKGIDDEVAKEALTEVDDEDEDASARVLVRRKLRSVERVDRATAVRRLSGMLARKGYGPGIAFRVVKEELDSAGHGAGHGAGLGAGAGGGAGPVAGRGPSRRAGFGTVFGTGDGPLVDDPDALDSGDDGLS